MKQSFLVNIFLLLLTTVVSTVQAAPISIGNIDDIYVANALLGSSSSPACETTQNKKNCDFLKTGPTKFLNNSDLASIVTNNPASYVLSPFKNKTSFDLGFDGYDIFTGQGNDLVIFIVGNSTSFGLDVFDKQGKKIGKTKDKNNVVSTDNTVFAKNGDWLCVNGNDSLCTDGAALSALFFDLDDLGTQIGSIRISLGEHFNGEDDTRPRFSLAGGFHNEAIITPVPLPLPALLFGSGLGLLGWIARRKPTA